MLSFKKDGEFERRLSELSEEERGLADFYLSQIEQMDSAETLAQISQGCLIFRQYSDETGYYFEAPIPLNDSADVVAAYREIAEYCVRECIPEVIVGVPEEDVEYLEKTVPHKELFMQDDGSYVLRVLTECMICDVLPELLYGDIYLGEFAVCYAERYKKLVTDRGVNRYYGYNASDIPGGVDAAAPQALIDEVRREFSMGEAMTFAVTVLSEEGDNVFIGDGTLYAFTGRGGASIAFRILPEWQGRGYGSQLLVALLKIAEKIGLNTVEAEVMKENIPSISLLRKLGVPERDLGRTVAFSVAIPLA